MPATRQLRVRWVSIATAVALCAGLALAGQPGGAASAGPLADFGLALHGPQPAVPARDVALTSFSLQEEEEEPVYERTDVTVIEEEAPGCPFSFDVTYYLYSDYIFRGINFSEYGTEGREKLNHQMTFDMGMDVAWLFGQERGTLGTFGFGTFFEWYAAQKVLDPIHGGQNLQEVDYVLSWSYDIDPIATCFTLGYTFYAFPNAKSINTSEWWLSLEHNDAWMWKWLFPDNEDGVLNPSFFMAQDVDIADGGMWFELGISHDFELFENFTLTPSALVAIDHRWLDPVVGTGRDGTTRLAYGQLGLEASYDLTPVLQLPNWAGGITLTGFLYFTDAWGTAEDDRTIQDEFYGGMSVGWSFGG